VRVVAPGKLLLSGAYAVLEGAPALVMAVDRYVVADDARRGSPSPEIAAAMPADEAPHVDASALFNGDKKLGLGSSAAGVVAALGVVAAVTLRACTTSASAPRRSSGIGATPRFVLP